MHLEAHAGLGWLLGNLLARDRALRNTVVLGAVLPDVDAVSYLFGSDVYAKAHHVLGHNAIVALAFLGCVALKQRSWRAVGLAALGIGSHLAADAWLSGWEVYLLWPFSNRGFIFPGAFGLAAPINTYLAYGSLAALVPLAWIFGRTPLDILSPGLDRLLLSTLRRRTKRCHSCGAACNQRCADCGAEVCFRHAVLGRGLRPVCPECARRES